MLVCFTIFSLFYLFYFSLLLSSFEISGIDNFYEMTLTIKMPVVAAQPAPLSAFLFRTQYILDIGEMDVIGQPQNISA